MSRRRALLAASAASGESRIFTFTIGGTEYQAEEGMTWGEWCNNINYNSTGKWIVFNGGVYSQNLDVQVVAVLSNIASIVLSTDVINEIDYQLAGRGSSGGS